MKSIKNTVGLCHYIINKRVKNNIKAVDMTAGNGHDSKFILDYKKPSKLYAFDIQKTAKKESLKLVGDRDNFTFILDNHKNIEKYIKEPIDLFIFNLGYLPKGDKSITTNYRDVISALKSSLKLLNDGGLIIICLYPGHKEGRLESIHIEDFLKDICQKSYQVIKYDFFNQINNPPYLMTIRKI